MLPVIVKHGIIKSDRVDLTVLPVSGKLKRLEEEGEQNRIDIQFYGTPAPSELESETFPKNLIGYLSELLVPKLNSEQSRFVVYASTSNGGSTEEAITDIGRRIGRLTIQESSIRLIEAPLLGTGKGGLDVELAVESLARGFIETRHPQAVLRIRNFTASLVSQAQVAVRRSAISVANSNIVLVLNATPDDQGRIRVDKEAAMLQEYLETVNAPQASVSVVHRFAVRLDQIQKELLRNRPNILHFSGHGDVGLLVFEDREGRTQVLDSKVFSDVVRAYGKLDCIVLNACYSEDVAKACSPYVGFVVGSQNVVNDATAPKFTYAFYQALAYGRSFENAFEMGRNEVAMTDPSEAMNYVLFRGKDPG